MRQQKKIAEDSAHKHEINTKKKKKNPPNQGNQVFFL